MGNPKGTDGVKVMNLKNSLDFPDGNNLMTELLKNGRGKCKKGRKERVKE